MPAKKQKQPKLGSGLNGTSADDILSVDVSSLGMSTITIPSYSGTSITTSGYTWNQAYDNYTISGSNGYSADVEINSKGLDLKNDADIKIEGRSFKEFMNSVEEQLAILRPAPELEERWEQLKELRQQYESLKADILEKEKIMKILKEK